MSPERPVVLHVVEPLAAGILKSISGLSRAMDGLATLYVLHGQRDLPPDYRLQFPETVKFLDWNVKREISLWHDILAIRQLHQVIGDIKPDIIHAHSSKAGALCRIPVPNSRHKLIYSPRGYSFARLDLSVVKRFAYFLIEWLLGRAAYLTIACGKAEYVAALKVARRVRLIPNMVSVVSCDKLDSSNEPIDNKPEASSISVPTIVMSGRIAPQKNFPFFCMVAAEMVDLPCQFLWIGDGPIPDETTVPSNVKVTGWKTYDETTRMVEESAIFFQCSLWEGLPNSVLEAMALGRPVVALAAMGNTELVVDGFNGYVCDDLAGAVRRLTELVGSRDTRKAFGEGSRAIIASNYSRDYLEEVWRSLYLNYERYYRHPS